MIIYKSEKNLIFIDLEKINFEKFNQSEKEKFLPLFFLFQILDEVSLKELKFSKSEILKCQVIKKMENIILDKKNIYELNEKERFDLHQELETIFPSFILFCQKISYRLD